MAITVLGGPRAPAIVLGSGHTGLGALRALALAGIPAHVACPRDDLATHSRHFRPLPGPHWDGRIGPHTTAILRALPFEAAVLLAGADDAALWLSDLSASSLATRYRTSSSSRATLQVLQDKALFGAYLAQAGIPHPRTFSLGSRAEVDAVPFGELDRVFLKPADSQQFSQALGVKGVWVHNRVEFEQAWSHFDGLGFKVVAQEYIPGSAADHYFVDGFRDRHGFLSGLFARRRLRIDPPDFGNSSYCRSIALGDVAQAVDSLGGLLDALHYRGIFSAEFKRDPRNGQFRLLEINTRAWWYVEFAARRGVNVCEMAYADACDLPVQASSRTYRVGAGCANLYGDIKSVLSPAAPHTPLATALGQWLRADLHVFRVDDPAPSLATFWSNLQRWMRKHWRKCRPLPPAQAA